MGAERMTMTDISWEKKNQHHHPITFEDWLGMGSHEW